MTEWIWSRCMCSSRMQHHSDYFIFHIPVDPIHDKRGGPFLKYLFICTLKKHLNNIIHKMLKLDFKLRYLWI